MVGLPARVARSLIIRGAGFYLEEKKMAPSSFVGFYDDGQPQTHMTNACFSDSLGGFIFQSENKIIIMDLRSDYEKALDDLNKDFPGVDISEILICTRGKYVKMFTHKNTMADAFQNIRYAFLLFLRELFR
jgi:hypothetical protein